MDSSAPSSPTPHAEVNAVMQDFTARVRAILGDNLVGVYLQGSLAVGDFDENSDIDWIIAIARELNDDEIAALRVLHDEFPTDERYWAQHIEGSYFPLDVLRDYTQASDPVWYVDHGSREMIRHNHCNTILVRWVVREMGIPLFGPDPTTLIGPMPVDALRREILGVITNWGAYLLTDPDEFRNRFYQAFIVINFSRMLHDMRAGCPSSKKQGVEWGLIHLDPAWHGLIERSWQRRPGSMIWQEADPTDWPLTLKFVQYIIDQSREYAAENDLL